MGAPSPPPLSASPASPLLLQLHQPPFFAGAFRRRARSSASVAGVHPGQLDRVRCGLPRLRPFRFGALRAATISASVLQHTGRSSEGLDRS